jgi:hypothetical protein
MAQIHRWYQIYENPQTTIENQLDILSSGIKLKSGVGEGVGHEAYKQRIAQLPTTWKNAHFVHATDVKIDADGTIALDVRLTYLNQAIKPDGTAVEIIQLSEGSAPAFKEAYAENRLKSLVHYWLALIEDPARRPELFQELLADGFELQLAGSEITDKAAFESWLRGWGSAPAAGTHRISGFSFEPAGADSYRLQMALSQHRPSPNGQEEVTKTRHVWMVIDNPKERFARIKTASTS